MNVLEFTSLTVTAALIGAMTSTSLHPVSASEATQKEVSALTVRAQRFVLVDSSGTMKAEFGIVGEKDSWNGCHGGAAAEPAPNLTGVGLVLYGENNKPAVVLHHAGKASEVSVCNADGKLRAELGVFSGDPHIRLFASDGKPSLTADLNSQSSYISLYDPRAKGLEPRVLVQAGQNMKTGSGSLVVLIGDGKIIWQAP